MKKVLSTLIIIALVAAPVVATATNGAGACAQAQTAAKQDANSTLWFLLGLGLGCLGSPIGGLVAMILGYSLNAQPSATALLGKSPEYVAAYTDCYAKEVKSTRGNNALYGCLIGGGGCVVATIIYYAAIVAVFVPMY